MAEAEADALRGVERKRARVNINNKFVSLFEGDIVVRKSEVQTGYGPEVVEDLQSEGFAFEEEEKGEESAAAKGRGLAVIVNKRWPLRKDGKALIEYEITDDPWLDEESIQAINEAIAALEATGVLMFAKRTGDVYIEVGANDKNSCHSAGVGFHGRKGQPYVGKINLGWCRHSKGSIIHEFLHQLGFWHEQSRYDRDNYVQVLMENIKPEYQGQFYKRKQEDDESHKMQSPYDFGSIMHYPRKAFSANGQDTIRPIVSVTATIGQRSGLSSEDTMQIRQKYQCESGTRSDGPLTSFNLCTEDCPCWEGAMGMCTSDDQCQEGLVCGAPLLSPSDAKEQGLTLPEKMCVKPEQRCTEYSPCPLGQGMCHLNDRNCQGSMICDNSFDMCVDRQFDLVYYAIGAGALLIMSLLGAVLLVRRKQRFKEKTGAKGGARAVQGRGKAGKKSGPATSKPELDLECGQDTDTSADITETVVDWVRTSSARASEWMGSWGEALNSNPASQQPPLPPQQQERPNTPSSAPPNPFTSWGTNQQQDRPELSKNQLLAKQKASKSTASPSNASRQASKQTQKAQRAGPPTAANRKRGCYLLVDPATKIVYCHWSESGEVSGSPIAFFSTGKAVPAYKFKQNGGRENILETKGDKKKTFQAIAQFVKSAAVQQGTLTLLDASSVRASIFLYERSKGILELKKNSPILVSKQGWEAVGVLPRPSSVFRGVSGTSQSHFCGTANERGAAMTF